MTGHLHVRHEDGQIIHRFWADPPILNEDDLEAAGDDALGRFQHDHAGKGPVLSLDYSTGAYEIAMSEKP